MHQLWARLTEDIDLTGDTRSDIVLLLRRFGLTKTVEHSLRVAAEAERLAVRFDADPAQRTRVSAAEAGWLHDISAIYPVVERVHVAQQLGLEILPAESAAPMLLHQKISAVMAKEVFGVTDRAVLEAIDCHTTLRAGASLLDKVLFVADKMAWDQPGIPPYRQGILHALDRSLDQAVFCYLDYLWQRRSALQAVHPWFVRAHTELKPVTSARSARQKAE